MANVAGKTNIVYILTGEVAMADGTGAKIDGVDSSTFNQLCDILDISQFGDDYKVRLAGMKDSSFSLSGNYNSTDTSGQDELVPGDTVFIGAYPLGIAVAGKQVKCIVESFEQSSDANGKQTFSASLQGTAAPVALPAQS